MPKQFNMMIADQVVGITSLFDSTYSFCKDYIADAASDFEVVIRQEDIQLERDKSIREAVLEGHAPADYSDSYLETLALYRKIAFGLLDYDVLLFHGSAIAVDGAAYLFTAKSGTGKSTHAKLWREYFGDRAVMVNDDKPLLKITKSGVVAYGTPWNGKHHLSSNISVPLKAICILTRDQNNHIDRIDKRTAFPMLCQQSYRPNDAAALSKTISLLDKLGSCVELYQLGCNMERNAAAVAYSGMSGKERQ